MKDSSNPKWKEGLSQVLRDMLPSTAYHEAGHAVVAYVVGFGVNKVSVLPRPLNERECCELATDGRNRYAVGEADIDYGAAVRNGEVCNVSLKPWAMSYLAGGLAQLKAGYGSNPKDCEHDAVVVRDHAYRLLGDKGKEWVVAVTADTERLLKADDVWTGVTVTVGLLMERGSLCEEEFQREVSPLFGDRKFLGCGF